MKCESDAHHNITVEWTDTAKWYSCPLCQTMRLLNAANSILVSQDTIITALKRDGLLSGPPIVELEDLN